MAIEWMMFCWGDIYDGVSNQYARVVLGINQFVCFRKRISKGLSAVMTFRII